MTWDEIKQIILKNIYRTDFINPRLTVFQQAILDQIFSRTILVGKETVRLSFGHLHRLTGISTPAISKAVRHLIREGYLEIVSEWKPKVPIEYRIKIDIPAGLRTFFQPQRSPELVFSEVFIQEGFSEGFELTAEGHAAINAIKESMSVYEHDLYVKKARQELLSQGAELTERAVNEKITEILLRNISDEKKRRWVRST